MSRIERTFGSYGEPIVAGIRLTTQPVSHKRYHTRVGWEGRRCSWKAEVIAGEGACAFCHLLSDEAAEQRGGDYESRAR